MNGVWTTCLIAVNNLRFRKTIQWCWSTSRIKLSQMTLVCVTEHCIPLCLSNTQLTQQPDNVVACSVGFGALHFTERHSAPCCDSVNSTACAINQSFSAATQHIRQCQSAADHTVEPSQAGPQINHGYDALLLVTGSRFNFRPPCCWSAQQ